MPSAKHISIIGLSILAYIAISLMLFYQVIILGIEEGGSIVPISGLLDWQHVSFFVIVWPVLGSLILIPLIPRIVVPLFTRISTTAKGERHEGFIELERDPLSIKTVISRAFFTFLLVMGLESTIVPMLDLTLFIPVLEYQDWENTIPSTIPLHLHPNIFIVTAAMLLPIAISIFACVWMLEDSGLVHYDLPNDVTKYQEIRPVYQRLSGYLKGFAGISALFYYIGAIMEMIECGTDSLTFSWVAFVSVMAFVWALVGNVIYSRLNQSWVRKGRTQLERVQDII